MNIVNKAGVRLQKVLGVLLCIVCIPPAATFLLLMAAFLFTESDGELVVIMTVLMIPFLLLSLVGLEKLRLVRHMKDYVRRISTERSLSVERLAASTGRQQKEVVKELQKMIGKDLLVNLYLDHTSKELVLQFAPDGWAAPVQAESAPARTVECRSCGARMHLASATGGECEFCGSALE